MRTFFKKNIIKAPIDGSIVLLKDIPDPAFSNGMISDGIAIRPSSTCVVSPCSGIVFLIAQTKHAIGIIGNDGIEILIHLGLDTVKLNGNGFEVLVNKGDIVSIGTPLINIDSQLLLNTDTFIVPIFICNNQKFNITQLTSKKTVETGVHTIFEYKKIE